LEDSIARPTDGGAPFASASFVNQAPTPGASNVSSGPVDYTTWASANGISGEPSDGDFDGDGIPNGVEYAIDGLDPTAFDSLGGSLSFTKRAIAVANGDVIYSIEESTDLGATDDWTEVSGPGYVNDDTTISYTLPVGQTRLFARLRIAPVVVLP
jgi:hypothetical protein